MVKESVTSLVTRNHRPLVKGCKTEEQTKTDGAPKPSHHHLQMLAIAMESKIEAPERVVGLHRP